METAREILNRVFGYASFRGDQEAIISTILRGESALVLMPTGGGKSLCYQIPALVQEGTAVVISPLIALMQNQVTALQQSGVSCAYLNSSQSREEQDNVLAKLQLNQLKLIYIAPERLMTADMLNTLADLDISLFAIDEAHCVSQWGHDFRKEYLQLDILAKRFAHVPRLALTATADQRTRLEIVDKLSLSGPIFVSDFDRPNIQYRIAAKNSPKKQLLKFILEEHSGDCGIVYCMTRKKTEETAKFLQDNGLRAHAYHAGMGADHRSKVQDLFINESDVIIVATIAFGMGIDKPDVRFVAHLDLSKNMESYYQETGRAGRDGEPATAWMVYGFQDVVLLRQMLARSDADPMHKRVEQSKLDAFLGLCEASDCRRQVLLQYFGQNDAPKCGNCDLCLNPVEKFNGTEAAQKILSACYRTGQRFGANHLIDVVLGKSNERMIRFSHDQLPTFGVGQEFNSLQWKSIIRQLVALNYLGVDQEGYGGLFLTPSASAILRGEKEIWFHSEILQQKPNIEKKESRKAKGGKSHSLSGAEAELFDHLRELRQTLAKKAKVPPYVIFHDRSLLEMVEKKPKDLQAFAQIIGVGEQKLAKYGEIFMSLWMKV